MPHLAPRSFPHRRIAAGLALALAGLAALAGNAPAASRSVSAGRFALFVDGETVGIQDLEGGDWRPSVQIDPASGAKRLGELVVEPIRFRVSLGEAPPSLLAWVADFTAGRAPRRDLELLEDLGDGRVAATSYFDAQLLEVALPALDVASGTGAELRLSIVARHRGVEHASIGELATAGDDTGKKWTPSGFRIEIDGLPCGQVTRIEGLRWHQSAQGLEVPNLKITFSAADAEAWEEWFADFVLLGRNDDEDELGGQITWLGPDHQSTLFVDFLGLGIVALEPAEDGEDALVAELYAEQASSELAVESGRESVVPDML